MTATQEPLVPAGVNLQHLEWMPLLVRRLRDSRLIASRSPEECLAAVLLWSASWHQVPASSVPGNDMELSSLAGYGRAVREFARIREGALHGFILCADGRLYHPLVADKAAEAWNGKLLSDWERACERTRKENQKRRERGEDPAGIPEKPTVLSRHLTEGIPVWRYTDSDGIPREPYGPEDGNHADFALKGKSKSKGNIPPSTPPFTIPEWIPQEPWKAFCEMRQKIRKPMTDRAKELIVAKLEQLRGQGNDPRGVLLQSVENSWQGVFQIHTNGNGASRTSGGGQKNDRTAASASVFGQPQGAAGERVIDSSAERVE